MVCKHIAFASIALLFIAGAVGPARADDRAEAEALVERLNANAEGAIWRHRGFGYFERNHRATLTELGALEIAYEQCTVWGPDLQGKTLDEMMALCGTGNLRWKATRFSLPLAVADDAVTEILRGDADINELSLRVVFNCSQRIFGCAQRLEGTEGRADFGVLCRDWITCGESAAAVTRLIAIAKSGGL